VWREYEEFIAELTSKFPHEKEGIRKLYDEFWKVRCVGRPCLGAAVACGGSCRAIGQDQRAAGPPHTSQPPYNPLTPTSPPLLSPPCSRQVFNALNSLELKSLEEPRYLLEQFGQHPLACLTLASFVATNTGDVARKHIKVAA
jgi:hypothetical protein